MSQFPPPPPVDGPEPEQGGSPVPPPPPPGVAVPPPLPGDSGDGSGKKVGLIIGLIVGLVTLIVVAAVILIFVVLGGDDDDDDNRADRDRETSQTDGDGDDDGGQPTPTPTVEVPPASGDLEDLTRTFVNVAWQHECEEFNQISNRDIQDQWNCEEDRDYFEGEETEWTVQINGVRTLEESSDYGVVEIDHRVDRFDHVDGYESCDVFLWELEWELVNGNWIVVFVDQTSAEEC